MGTSWVGSGYLAPLGGWGSRVGWDGARWWTPTTAPEPPLRLDDDVFDTEAHASRRVLTRLRLRPPSVVSVRVGPLGAWQVETCA